MATLPIKRLRTPLFEATWAKEVLRKHGCGVVEEKSCCTIYFPRGTIQTELFPRTMAMERFRIILPGGEVTFVYARDFIREVNILYLPRPDKTPVRKHKNSIKRSDD